MFEVKRITNVNWENSIVRATLDLIVLPHGIVLKDCMLKEAEHGFFVTSPSKKLKTPWTNPKTGKTHEYQDLAFFPAEIRPELERIVMEAYDPDGASQTSAPPAVKAKTLQDLEDVPF